jgi:hypothetical protein
MSNLGKEPRDLTLEEQQVLEELKMLLSEDGLMRMRLMCIVGSTSEGAFRMRPQSDESSSIGIRTVENKDKKVEERKVELEVGNGVFDIESWKNDIEGLAQELIAHGLKMLDIKELRAIIFGAEITLDNKEGAWTVGAYWLTPERMTVDEFIEKEKESQKTRKPEDIYSQKTRKQENI